MTLLRRHLALAPAALAATTLLSPIAALAADVSGVKIDDAVKVAGKDLRLNGAGVRTRAMFKVYAMGLYLGKKETTVDAVLASAGPRRITLVMMREVSGEDFGQAFMTGINNNTDKAEKSKIVNQMAKLGEVFVNVGGLKKGDTLNVDWLPERGTLIEMNGKLLSDPMPDQAFYNALLKIWLGDKPADSTLKPQLLGGA
ncbi:MAG: chalcone isomerase family protein [Rubrivivax sp.]|nr:chalcone isomerase family protein [Rubrivivax sp.]